LITSSTLHTDVSKVGSPFETSVAVHRSTQPNISVLDLQTKLIFGANKAIWADITDALKITCSVVFRTSVDRHYWCMQAPANSAAKHGDSIRGGIDPPLNMR